MRHHRSTGQSTVETALLFAIVVAALLGIQHYYKNAIEGRARQSADQIGQQWDAEQGSYTKSSSSTSSRTEDLAATGVTSSTAISEGQTQNINESLTRDTTLF